MRRKAIADLAQLSDDQLFATVSEGLAHIVENTDRLIADANRVQQAGGSQGVRVLEAIADEELAKYLILLDAIRCPREPAERFVRQLRRFNDHLAKGIYIRCYMYCPGTLGELRNWIERDCQAYYLDGPNDVDWIFDNEIKRQREQVMYVDYVESEGGHTWWPPSVTPPYTRFDGRALRLVRSLSAAGLGSPEGLRIIAELWRPVEIRDDLNWWPELRDLNFKTLEMLDKKSLLAGLPQDTYREIINTWLFPLYSVEIAEVPVDKKSLITVRERHLERLWPDW